jgi:predicted nucleic acid-binding protein
MYLLDTNIFLEILLKQEKSEECKNFLKSNVNNIFISDFSLHSIGVILFRYKKHKLYEDFIKDILSQI